MTNSPAVGDLSLEKVSGKMANLQYQDQRYFEFILMYVDVVFCSTSGIIVYDCYFVMSYDHMYVQYIIYIFV